MEQPTNRGVLFLRKYIKYWMTVLLSKIHVQVYITRTDVCVHSTVALTAFMVVRIVSKWHPPISVFPFLC